MMNHEKQTFVQAVDFLNAHIRLRLIGAKKTMRMMLELVLQSFNCMRLNVYRDSSWWISLAALQEHATDFRLVHNSVVVSSRQSFSLMVSGV